MGYNLSQKNRFWSSLNAISGDKYQNAMDVPTRKGGLHNVIYQKIEQPIS